MPDNDAKPMEPSEADWEEAAFHQALLDTAGVDLDDEEVEAVMAEVISDLAERYPAYKLPPILAAMRGMGGVRP